jgi:hypothetical protein
VSSSFVHELSTLLSLKCGGELCTTPANACELEEILVEAQFNNLDIRAFVLPSSAMEGQPKGHDSFDDILST